MPATFYWLRRVRSIVVAVAVVAAPAVVLPTFIPSISTAALAQDLSQEDQAANLLNAARRAYNDRNYSQAVEQFRQYTQKFGGMKDVHSAWYGLGLSLLDGPRDYAAAADALSRVVTQNESPDRPYALYFRATALRGEGMNALKVAAEKPNEAEGQRNAARQKFDQARQQFEEAAKAFAAERDKAEKGKKSPAIDWMMRSQCGHAEMLLRLERPKEAIAAIDSAADKSMMKHRYRPLALYYLGQARFGEKDYTGAGKALSILAPFDQEFGVHARYLLGRVHHIEGDRADAATQYKAVIDGVEQQRKSAQQQLQQPNLPADQKAYLEQVASGPQPDHLPRAMFYLGVLLSEEGKFPEAKDLFAKLTTDFKSHPLSPEAQARVGYCQLQSRQYQDAINTLTPLKDHATLGDQASWWLAKAQLAAADANNPQAVENAAKQAVGLLGQAANKAQQLSGNDAAAKVRRPDILMDLAEAQILAKSPRDAANTYRTIVAENAVPERTEEAFQRACTALHLAAAYDESNQECANFEKKYPKSTLLPAVWFREAENGYLKAIQYDAKPDANPADVERLYNNAIIAYQKLVKKYPEFQHVQLARQAMAICQMKLGKPDSAITLLTEIPDAERTGELATVGYLQADALIRTFPPETDDAIRAAGLIQQAEQSAKLLENFIASNPKHELTPDALLKMGYCYQRMAGLLAEKPERDKALQLGREAYERHLREFTDHPTRPAVFYERARMMALQGDIGGAINELRRFTTDPLKNAPNAPLAALRLATLLRSQNRAKEAAEMLARVRAEQEGNLLKDKSRAHWAPMLAYEQALSAKQAALQQPPVGTLADARKMFDEIAAKYTGKPEATNAVWRSAQCRREELSKQIDEATKKLARPGASKEEQAAALKVLDDAAVAMTEAAKPVAALAETIATNREAGSPAHLQLMYEQAWCDRVAADAETESARQKLRQERQAEIVEKLAKASQSPPPAVMTPDVPLSAVGLTPAGKRAREQYEKLIAAGDDKPIAVAARFELAELMADRGEHEPAVELLNAALLNAADQPIAERIRLRMAACLLATSDAKNATAAVGDLAKPAKPDQANQWSAVRGEAQFLLAEAAVQSKDWPKVIELLAPFRDVDQLRNLPGISDRALLRLGQAYAAAGQWEPSRQAFDALIQRYGQSPWTEEARFGVGYSFQKQGRFDEAINAYTEVTRRTAAEVAARSQVHIGLCRIEQKKYPEATAALLSVPYTYDYPEWSAAACYEAAKAFKEMQKPADAEAQLKKVVESYPETESAKLAKAMLNGGT